MNYDIKSKSFSLKSTINLPFKISKYKIGDSFLFIAPDKAAFIVSNDIGCQFVDLFKKQNSIEQVLEIMNTKGYQEEKVISELHSFLVEVEKRGFYEDAPTLNVNNELTLHLDLTNKCNLSCVHCLRNAGNPRPNELSTLEWIKTIDTFASQFKTSVCVSGGEALLHPGIFDIVRSAKENGLHVTLFSNGTLFNKQVVEKLVNFVDKIQLSLDGATPEINDKIRGEGCFDKVMRAFRLLENTSIELDLAISVMPQNVEDLNENIEKMMKQIGRKVNVRISPADKEGRAKETHVFKSDDMAKNEVRKLMAHVYTKKLKNLTKAEKNIKLTTCGYAETVVVSSVGDIFPCNVYEPKVKYGNVRVDDFTQIIKKIDKDRVALNVENIKKCSGCDIRYFCYGGCRLNNLYRNHDIMEPCCTAEFKKQICSYIVQKTLWLDSLLLIDYESQRRKSV